jgi:WD40 repeat protein
MKAQLIRTYQGHQARINAIVSINSHLVVTAAEENDLKLWNLDTDDVQFVLRGHLAPVRVLAAFQDSMFIVSGSADHTIIIWNCETGEAVRTLAGHTAPVTALAISPDGASIVSGSEDRTIIIWDSITGALKHRCNHHRGGIHALAITPNSRYVLAGETGAAEAGYAFKVWDLETGEHVRDFAEWHHGVTSMAMLDAGRVISSSTEGDVVVWNLENGMSSIIVETHRGSAVMALFPNLRYMVVGTQKPQLTIWNVETGEELYSLAQPTDWVSSVFVSRDGRKVLAGCHDGTLNIYEIVG